MLLDIRQLDIAYADSSQPVVQGVELSLDAGQILTIVGESGSGKTTVIRAIMGCLPGSGRVSAGSICFQGKELQTCTPKEWRSLRGRDISMIFQDSGNMMNPVHTIGRQFIEYIRTHSDNTAGQAEAKAVEMLARMNLPNPEHILASYPFELSGGMRQRVGIAMAITFHPRLLLADEPTSALDVTTQAQIVQELNGIVRESGTAMILVTHNIGVAAWMSDQIMVMERGKVVEYGPAADVIDHPQAAYTKKLLEAVPEIGGRRYV